MLNRDSLACKGWAAKPGEAKHHSTQRKREKFYSLSSGERRGNSPELFFCFARSRKIAVVSLVRSKAIWTEFKSCGLSRRISLEREAKDGNSPVAERHHIL